SRTQFVKGDVTKKEDLETLFSMNDIDAIMHFAGLISVEESEKEPEKYRKVNTEGSRLLFDTAVETKGIKNFIFSSTAAVYGNPEFIPIPENHAKNPTSNYGKTKLATENYLEELRQKD